jgi:hypothetical protein
MVPESIFPKFKILLDRFLSPFVILLDFEVAMQQACIIAFLDFHIKGK